MNVKYNKYHDNVPYKQLNFNDKVRLTESNKISCKDRFYLKNDDSEIIRLLAGDKLGYSPSSRNSDNGELRQKADHYFEVTFPLIKLLKKHK